MPSVLLFDVPTSCTGRGTENILLPFHLVSLLELVHLPLIVQLAGHLQVLTTGHAEPVLQHHDAHPLSEALWGKLSTKARP